jgi:LmbE family N-acetylglucosaminyl deacetylase
MQVSWREALDIPDGRVENTFANRLKIARVIRATRPRVVILPYWKGRHPDHYTCSTVGYEACFLAGLKKLDVANRLRDEGVQLGEADDAPPHRPFKIVYATLYYDVRPTFVVDISTQFEARFSALMAYQTQFDNQQEGSGIFPARELIRQRVETMARFYGLLAGVEFAEPFLQKEVGLVDDLTALPVQSL